MDKRKCIWCGEEFIPHTGKQKSCGKDHYLPCPDCGKPVKVSNLTYSQYLRNGSKRCKDCVAKAVHERSLLRTDEERKEILEKRKATNLAKFGVEFASQSKDIQKRVVETNMKRYGVERPLQNSDIMQSMKNNVRSKYGVDHVSQVPEFKQRVASALKSQSKELLEVRKQTMLNRYGEDNPMKVPELVAKQQSAIERSLGVKYPMQSDSVKLKSRHTLMSHYGVEHPLQSEELKAKSRQTCMDRYGAVSYACTEEFNEQFKSICQERLGVDYPMQNDTIKAKSRQTCIDKYGHSTYLGSKYDLSSKVTDPAKLSLYLEFKNDPKLFISSHFLSKPTVYDIASMLGVTDTPVYDILISSGNRDLATERSSQMEANIAEILSSLNLVFVHNDRTAIKPYELDFYLPEYHFAIECNPTVTHNSSYKDPWGQDPKSSTYHSMKTDMCIDKDIQLFHVFGYEWQKSKDVIVSMILNSLGKSQNRIYARNTYVCEVPYKECCQFLGTNHRQGNTSASVRLGLRTKSDNRLVSVMTFNHTRSTIGKKSDYDENEWELSRFCSLLNTCVVGGASKLFKYFRNNYTYSKIISFSDRAHTSGKLYSVLGFQYVSTSSPSYVWVDMMNDSYLTRVACQKRNLRKLFGDETIDIESQTERQIMMDHGYGQVFDSGVIRWEFTDQSL